MLRELEMVGQNGSQEVKETDGGNGIIEELEYLIKAWKLAER